MNKMNYVLHRQGTKAGMHPIIIFMKEKYYSIFTINSILKQCINSHLVKLVSFS